MKFPDARAIHGYELGHHPAPTNPAASHSRIYGADEYELGESFVPLLEANIASHRELIELHIGDLTR